MAVHSKEKKKKKQEKQGTKSHGPSIIKYRRALKSVEVWKCNIRGIKIRKIEKKFRSKNHMVGAWYFFFFWPIRKKVGGSRNKYYRVQYFYFLAASLLHVLHSVILAGDLGKKSSTWRRQISKIKLVR